MSLKFNCYDCMWGTDKCKNEKSKRYNYFIPDIENCDMIDKDVDNSSGMSSREYKLWLEGVDVC